MVIEFKKKELGDLSVLVSCFNKEVYIPNFVSVARSLIKVGAEVVIVNDGSTDKSLDILKEISDVAQIISTSNLGVAHARNTALQASSRDYVVFLDIDDSLNLESLSHGLKRMRANNSDLSVGSYLRIQDGYVSPAPIESDIRMSLTTNFEVSTKMLEGMGFWRYIYAREFIRRFQLNFSPTFQDMGGKFFILDDFFWMLHLSACLDFSLVLVDSQDPLYEYHYEIPQPDAKWNSFVRQIKLLPQAFLVFETVLDTCNHEHRDNWLVEAGQKNLARHLRYLSISKFLKVLPYAFFFVIRSKYFYRDKKILGALEIIIACGPRSIRNSLALLKKRVLSSITFTQKLARVRHL